MTVHKKSKFQYIEERVLRYSDAFLKGLYTDVMGLFSWSEMLFYLWNTELVVLHWLLLNLILISVPQKKGDFKGILIQERKGLLQNLFDNYTRVCIHSSASTVICCKCGRGSFMQTFQYTGPNHCSFKLHLAMEILQIE